MEIPLLLKALIMGVVEGLTEIGVRHSKIGLYATPEPKRMN